MAPEQRLAKERTRAYNGERGMDLLSHPVWNKSTAFSQVERRQFGLDGLLPPHLETLDEQVIRAYEAYKRKDEDLERHIFLRALQDANEVFNPEFCRHLNFISSSDLDLECPTL
jgi:hypothetical protein